MSTHTKQYIYISTGETNGFYTLRSKYYSENDHRFVWCDRFIKNSSRDWEVAIGEARMVAKERGAKLITSPYDKWELNEWGTGKTSVTRISIYYEWMAWLLDGNMPFGKHRGTKLRELPESYRIWLRKQADGSKQWNLLMEQLEPFKSIDDAYEAQRDKEREKRQQEWKALRENSDHVGRIGDRITLTLTCEHKRPYNGHFGPGNISSLRDDKGNVFKTFGKCVLNVGDTSVVKATIKKHDEYKGEKQNIITRIQVQEQ